jgi:probable HAF family extracellular repeat protein
VYDARINSYRSYAVWWNNGVIQNLGEGNAMAVNQPGTIVGSVVGGLSLYRQGQWTHLGFGGAPFAINNSEAIAGWFVNGLPHAFLYSGGVLSDLGTFGGTSSAATSLNDRGQVVGYASLPSGANHAFLYESGAMHDLGTLGGGTESRAHDINNGGTVVGEAWDARGDSRPFIYDGTSMRYLFQTASCCVVPRALNDRGDVVGTIAGNASFLYSDGVLTRLESLPAVASAGWYQLIPMDINDRGWVVGMGRKSASAQTWQAFVLRPGP